MSDPLVDTFGRKHTYLRIAVTERCNLRCLYCMPEEGVHLTAREHILSFEEIERLARLFARLGVDKIRLTGGEPLVRKELEVLVGRLAQIEGINTVALTTNGLLLPRMIEQLHQAGLTHLNISLDTLDPQRFEAITRRPGIEAVLEGIQMAVEIGYDPVKVNCVVMRGTNDDELVRFADLTADRPIDVRFIEYMPFDGNNWSDREFIPYREMLERITNAFPGVERLPDGPADTSKSYRVPGYKGTIGFISSMSDEFCGTCNRVRLTADGNLKVCLFGNAEVSLKDAMRAGADDSELEELIRAAVLRKKAAHAGMYQIAASENRPMILIGG